MSATAHPQAWTYDYKRPSTAPLRLRRAVCVAKPWHSLDTDTFDIASLAAEDESQYVLESRVQRLLDRIFADAHWITELSDDWDGEGSQGYAEATLMRARAFLERTFDAWFECFSNSAPLPVVNPSEMGSIDIRFASGKRTLLINIPRQANQRAAFAGTNGALDSISGLLSLDEPRLDLLAWLNPAA